jgi:GxxExxY protein
MTQFEGRAMADNGRISEWEKTESHRWSGLILGAAIEVHRCLGPGLLESAYEECLCHELLMRDIPFERQEPLPLNYKGLRLECAYRIDLIVGSLVVVELKSIERVEAIHVSQLLTYLRLRKLWLGLLINFNVPILKNGIKRLVCG